MRKSRVLLFAAGLVLLLLVVWGRVLWFQTVLHPEFEEQARAAQQHREKVLPKRGEIRDRNGVVLAHDIGVSMVAVNPRLMKDPHAVALLLAPAVGEKPAVLERRLRACRRYTWFARDLQPEVGERLRAARLEGLEVVDQTKRHYRLAESACEVVGRTNRDNVGADGIEFQFDEQLGGTTGWRNLLPTGSRSASLPMPGGDQRAARDGATLQLTIDADLQAIVEQHLQQGVREHNAKRGFAIFLDPATGEILSSACYPHQPAGQAKNWNFTDMYEPGSTFKVVVAGATLEEHLSRPSEVLIGSRTGAAELLPGFVLHDTHPHERLTFFGAMQNSSNIMMGRLALRVGAQRMHRYITSLGFGDLTGIEFPGESPGRLRGVEQWQPRSLPTVAIGQEVAVTPLQLALAYGAIANGGVLMQPMLVRRVVSPEGRVLVENEPQSVRRVFSESTTRQLMDMLCAVVDSGTATAARLESVRIAGKTGTAQKVDPLTRRYGRGMYIGSFAGVAPANRPRLVGVVVIDEPRGGAYYGGLVSAPVFREIMLDLERMAWKGFGTEAPAIASRPPAVPAVSAPDLRLLTAAAAEKRLATFGLHVRFEGRGSRVLSQEPPAGQPVDRGSVVLARLAAPEDSTGRVLPDVTGQTVRQAMRTLGRHGVKMRYSGSGLVARQEPAAGTPLPLSGPCRLWCSPDAEPAAERVTPPSPVATRTRRP